MGYFSFPSQKEKLLCTCINTKPLNTFQILNIQMERERVKGRQYCSGLVEGLEAKIWADRSQLVDGVLSPICNRE